MEITGILMRKVDDRTGTSSRNGNSWRIAEFLIEVPGQYPRHTVFSVSDGQNARIARFEQLVGKTVTVSFDLDAHEVQGRWYNDLRAWGIMEYVAGRTVKPQEQPQEAAPVINDPVVLGGEKTPPESPEAKPDDLPF